MSVTVRFDKEFPVDAWLALYKAADYNAWWTECNARAALAYAYFVVSAWDGEQTVATLTVWSDGMNFAWIDDLVVHPDRRGRGIGSLLVAEAVSRLRHDSVAAVQVFPVPGREPFFERLGFTVQAGATVMDLKASSPRR